MSNALTILIAASLAAGAAEPKAPVTLAPLTPWNLDYGENSCKLARTFGDKANPLTLIFERIGPGSRMTMIALGGPLGAPMSAGWAKASFLPFAERVFEDGMIAETKETKKTAILWSGVGFVDEERLSPSDRRLKDRERRDLAKEEAERAEIDRNAASVTAVRIAEPGRKPILLQTGAMGKGVAMMRDCARDQLRTWGIDPAVEDKIVVRAKATKDLASLLDWRDYPSNAMREGQQQKLDYRLNVDATGKVTRCVTLTMFDSPEFGKVVCDKFSRARFLPAELADGTKVPTYVNGSVRFQMPD